MRNAKYTVKSTTQFKKDYKLAMRRGLDISLLEGVLAALQPYVDNLVGLCDQLQLMLHNHIKRLSCIC
ncbi:hypothetical protein [Candidatus Merdisoma sp. JLR.KK011]|uniref:hypothetical protein n=1 Tax=Candidatus Merdisoma sp. JLR.KK011 TaxID=3114299 RepID=UPI003FA61501